MIAVFQTSTCVKSCHLCRTVIMMRKNKHENQLHHARETSGGRVAKESTASTGKSAHIVISIKAIISPLLSGFLIIDSFLILEVVRVSFDHSDKFYAIFWKDFRRYHMARHKSNMIVHRKRYSWFQLQCIVNKFMCTQPSSSDWQSQDINRTLWIRESISRIK